MSSSTKSERKWSCLKFNFVFYISIMQTMLMKLPAETSNIHVHCLFEIKTRLHFLIKALFFRRPNSLANEENKKLLSIK